MQLLKSGSILILLMILFTEKSKSQQVINNVTIEKRSSHLYRIQYVFNQTPDFNIEKAILKIYRRRNGNVQEIFTLPVSVPNSIEESQKQYSFDWTASNGIVQNGDDLQAKIILTLKTSATKQRLNRIPVADAGSFMQMELPVTKPIELNGSKSRDEDGKLIFIEWKQIGGPSSLNISHKDSLVAYAEGDFKVGTYAFELTVKDNLGSVSIGRTTVTIKERPFWSTEQPVKNAAPQKTNTIPRPTQVKQQTKLKGGPSNAGINLLLPGLGHYFVSGNYEGENKKVSAFAVTGMYVASLAGAFYFNSKSNDLNKKYNELANYRDYQKDANGNIIGVRGVNQSQAENYYNDAKAAHRNSLICLGVGGGVLIGDFIYTFLKGNKNKKEWQTHNTSFQSKLFISTSGSGMMAGVQIKF